MNTITILVGENINDLWFQQGGSAVLGLHVEEGYCSKWIYNHESTVRKCPEDGKHPRVYQKWLTEDVGYVLNHWNYILSTNSMHTINIISELVREGVIHWEDVEIIGLSSDNKEIIFKSGFDSEGYLDYRWTIGFLSLA